ncbi:ATP-binding protein [Synechococcus sp. GEYO]|uniref:ATP/GTP-binding protein n=1 Tax=Synechococcus sp. GEYO TaxID=2575511 RepID=UPI001482E57D|nr:ATP-binding protein [Synechococcus sp. GEYO]
MRIAISGSHSLGKSTLVWDWIKRHPQYTREEEPFRALYGEMYDIRFRQECNRLHDGIQMYYNASRVSLYSSINDCVIFDRAPIDYIAYSQYTADKQITDIDNAFVEAMVPRVIERLQRLDLVVFVPMTDRWSVDMEDDGIRPVDLPYRAEVDAIFKQIYRDKRFSVMPDKNRSKLIELWGSREQRLDRLEQAAASSLP